MKYMAASMTNAAWPHRIAQTRPESSTAPLAEQRPRLSDAAHGTHGGMTPPAPLAGGREEADDREVKDRTIADGVRAAWLNISEARVASASDGARVAGGIAVAAAARVVVSASDGARRTAAAASKRTRPNMVRLSSLDAPFEAPVW